MVREILIITKDRQVFKRIKKACVPICEDTHSFVFARDIQSAASHLRNGNVAVVLLGLLAREDPTFSFLSYIWKFFPDIPVINRGGFRESPESMMIEEKGIAVRPVNTISPKKWPGIIKNTLEIEKAGGALAMSEVSVFAQMIQQEQRTCTLRVYDDVNDRSGTLFFQDGELKNARVQTVQGKPAALEVLMWEKIRIDIQDTCDWVKQRIDHNLQALLIESTLQQDSVEAGDTNSSWADAARDEEQSYQKLLTQVHGGSVSSNKKQYAAFFEAAQTSQLKTFRRFIPITVIIALVFLVITVYMTNLPRNDSSFEEIPFQQKRATLTSVHPITQSKPKVANAGKGIENHELPVQTAVSPIKTDPTEKEKSVDTPSKIKLLPPAPRFKIKPAPAPPSPIVFIHYTYPRNRGRADQLADFLTRRGFIIKGVEQVAFHRNDIRFFQAADREKARTLRDQITRFLVESGKLKTIPPLNLKDMTGTYSHTSPGQLEIWLRLPST